MCYNVEIYLTKAQIEAYFALEFEGGENFKANHLLNAFTLPFLPVVTQESPEKIQLMQWGLVPYWVKNENQAAEIKTKTFNARQETAHEKPSFKKPLESQRCLIAARGFFEWQHRNKERLPFYIHQKDQQIFSFAGIYDQWINPSSGEIAHGFSILTTEANPLMEKIHNSKKRMPVVLDQSQEKNWINPLVDTAAARNMLAEAHNSNLQAHRISKLINQKGADKNQPNLIQALPPQKEQGSLF